MLKSGFISVDGTEIHVNCARKATLTKESVKVCLNRLSAQMEEYLQQMDGTDKQEDVSERFLEELAEVCGQMEKVPRAYTELHSFGKGEPSKGRPEGGEPVDDRKAANSEMSAEAEFSLSSLGYNITRLRNLGKLNDALKIVQSS